MPAAAMTLTLLSSLLAVCLVLAAGGVVARLSFLARYRIPAPIIGDLIVTVAALFGH